MLNKKQVLWAVSLFGVALWGNSGDGDEHFLRRLAVECIHNVYATEETVKKIPPVPASQNHELPAYISLCQEWIRHDACKTAACIIDVGIMCHALMFSNSYRFFTILFPQTTMKRTPMTITR